MYANLETRRRVLLLTYQRYLDADRTWSLAQREVRTWFPKASQRGLTAIGNPGSIVRRLYDKRERARLQLDIAYLKLEAAKQRLADRQRKANGSRVLYITHVSAS